VSRHGEERTPPDSAVATGWDLVRSPEAGARVIRGGMLRGTGYVAGVALTAAVSIFLLRYLGVVDFGRYVTVMSLVAIVGGIADVGLTAVANRELATRRLAAERLRLMRNLIGLRVLLTPIGVLAAVGFALAVGYDRTLVIGTALAGTGLVLTATQMTAVLPLTAELRLGALTAVELLRQVVLVIGIALLVAVGAPLLGFFAIQIAVGIAVLAVTPFLLGRSFVWNPAFDRSEWRWLLLEALPVGAGLAMNVIYFRTLIVMMSLIASGRQTGLFGTSFRIFEILFGAAGIVLPVAMPVLAVAAEANAERLHYALQRMSEVGLVAATGFALVLAFAAEPLLVLLGGGEYRDAAPVLQIQAVALIPVFLGQSWQLGLIALRKQSALFFANAAAFVVVVLAGLLLIPPYDAVGGAIAAVIGESVLAGALLAILVRRSGSVRPRFGFAWKVALAAAPAVAVVLVPGLSASMRAALAGAVFAVGVWLSGALPAEVLAAIRLPRVRS
jgi:O-antigen/teichoic acid export membrane protein